MKHSVQDGFLYYVELVEGRDLRELLESSDHFDLLESIGEAKAAYRYAPGKWSIKQILGHITDHERVMAYRALRFSRNDKTALPGYDQDIFVNNSRFDDLGWPQLVADFRNVRIATMSFIDALSEDQLRRSGKASGFDMTVENCLRSAAGHEMHHMKILQERYL